MKGLIRKRSTTAARLQRAFSAKSLRTSSAGAVNLTPAGDAVDGTGVSSPSLPPQTPTNAMTPVRPEKEKRQFIMETSVQFINGLQSRDRHLFLFNDLLLIAKARSGGHFKLKDKVRISELWLSTNVEDVAEGSAGKSRDTSFVIGWPPSASMVATFSSPALRDLWWNRLGQAVKDERDKEPKTTTIQITYHDAATGIGYTKTLSVSPVDTVRDVIKVALSNLDVTGTSDPNAFRLWLRTGTGSSSSSSSSLSTTSALDGDTSPYPLIGHELPFAIKMNCLRDYIGRTAAENALDTSFTNMDSGLATIDVLDHCNNIYSADPAARCQFILRSVQKPNYTGGGLGKSPGVGKTSAGPAKAKKSPTRIQKVFRRVQSKPDSLETVGASPSAAAAAGALFAQPLCKICPQPDALPQPIMDMLVELRAKGPHTVGIFRKSANARQVREIRERIDASVTGARMDWSGINAVVIAVVFKDFLRSLPDSLLCSGLYDQWLQAATMDGQDAVLDKIKGLCDRLPNANVTLLRHFLCVLTHIAANSSQNMMSASNLAVCVGPSLLWAPVTNCVNPALALSAEAAASKQVPALVTVLIDKCTVLFGSETANLLNEQGSPAPVPDTQINRRITNSAPASRCRQAPVHKHMARHGLLQHDSGNEESDSLHSLYHSDMMRRDDSSIDSLERELLNDVDHEHHAHVIQMRRDKMSVTNLSRDSGLTLSDTQLYTPDEDMEEGSESSSSGRGSDRDKSRQPVQLRQRSTPNTPGTPSRAEQTRSMYAVPVMRSEKSRLESYSKGPSSYTPVYDQMARPDAIYRKLSDDAVYAVPKATPTVVLAEEYQSAGSHFQRQDWFRRKSHNRKQSGGVKFDSPSMPTGMMLRRSASDESLANISLIPDHIGYTQNAKKPAAHRKGRAPAPPNNININNSSSSHRASLDCTELSRRSKSDAHLEMDGRDELDNQRKTVHTSSPAIRPSHSTPQMAAEEPASSTADRSYDSSTLSDDDATPHVSRSNSRGSKDYRAVNSAWESTYGALTVPVPAPIHIIVSQDGTGSVVYPSNNNNNNNSKQQNRASNAATAHYDQRRHDQRRPIGNSTPTSRSSFYCATPPSGRFSDYDTVIYSSRRCSRDQRADDSSLYSIHSSTNGSRNGTPDIPSYEEAIRRQRSQQQLGNTSWTTWKDERGNKSNNNSLIQVRASPLRLNNVNSTTVDESGWDSSEGLNPPPLPPKSEPIPPLPPKQRIHLRSHPVRMRLHSNSPASNRTRPVTIHMDASILSNLDGSKCPSPTATQPPSLPRKERRGNNVSVVSIENTYAPLHRSFAFSTHNLRTAMESAGRDEWSGDAEDNQQQQQQQRRDQEIQTSGHWAQFCEIETQTSLSPQPSLASSSSASSSADEAPQPKVTLVGRYEKNTRGVSGSRRHEVERSRPRTRDASVGRDLHRSHSLPPLDKASSVSDGTDTDEPGDVEPDNQKTPAANCATSHRRPEISWSVSQLRALFNGAGASNPPPYRSPPVHKEQQQQQQSSQASSSRQRSESTDSYGEESYV